MSDINEEKCVQYRNVGSHKMDCSEVVNSNLVKFPDIAVELCGRDGNAFSIIASVIRELKKFGVSKEEIDEFSSEAMSGDYNHLLQTCMRWVDVC